MSKFIPNTTPVPNILMDEIWQYLKPAEKDVLLYLCRRTYGFHRDRERISITQFTDGKFSRDGKRLDHGSATGRATTIAALKSLTELGLITQTKPAVRFPPSQRRAAEWAVTTSEETVNWPDLITRKEAKSEADYKRMAHRISAKSEQEEIESEDQEYYFEDDF